MSNFDKHVVEMFGDEWNRFDQTAMSDEERLEIFDKYFHILPEGTLSKDHIGFDLGCGSGRWARVVAPRVGHLHCIDPAKLALETAKKNLASQENVSFHNETVDAMSIPNNSMDFGYSLGVLHHVPDTVAGIKSCVAKLKIGAPFLIYLYYNFDNRSLWYKYLHKLSEVFRYAISSFGPKSRAITCNIIAFTVYFPLARTSYILEKLGINVKNFPLSFYRDKSLYVMQTDALDRFGTSLEQRFSREEIKKMLEQAGLKNITFSEKEPYWCAVGIKES